MSALRVLAFVMLALSAGLAHSAISLRVGAAAGGSAAGGIGVTRLDGTGEGDFVLVVLTVEGRTAAQVTDPAGWTRVAGLDNSNQTTVVAYRFAATADVSGAAPTWNWTWAGTREFVVSRLVFRGVDATTPLNTSASTQFTNDAAAIAVPAVTPTVAGTLLVAIGTINLGATFASGAGITEATDGQSGNAGGNIAHTVATGAGPAANVSSGTRTITASAADNRRLGLMLALGPAAVPAAVLRLRFDEGAWNGTANEVRDASGNNLHGRALGTGTTATTTAANNGSPAFCRSGLFNAANTQYVEVADNALLDITSRLTVTAWVRPAALPPAGSLRTIASKDENYEFHVTETGAVNWWWTAGANAITTGAGVVPVNAWTHVAIVFARGAQEVFINGVLAANNWTAPDRNPLTANADPLQVGADHGFAGRYFGGQIDEVRVYSYAMSAADVLAVRNEVPAPLCPIDHFSIVPTGGTSASTCLAKAFTITAQDVNNATFAGYTGTINITTSTSRGTWTNGNGAGAFSDPTVNDGAAQYTFVAGDGGDVVLNLSNNSQDDLTVTATDSASAAVTGTSATIAFRDNVFIFAEDLGGLVAGTDVAVAGRAHDMRATYIYRDTSTSNCGTLTTYTGPKSLKAWITRAGTDPAGTAPQISGTSLPNVAPGANNLAMTFTNGVANFNLSTTDVGKYALNFRDDAPVVANTAVSGTTGDLTVRPFAIAVSDIRQGATANPGSSTPGGTVFAAAGSNFQMTVTAYRHSAAADANNDGVPEAAATLAQVSAMGATPGFTAITTFMPTLPYSPAAGGLLNNGSFALAAGTATPTDLNFTEVGSFTLSTTGVVSAYLGTAGLDLNATVFDSSGAQVTAAPVVGRFRPDHFFLAPAPPAPMLTNRIVAACAPASNFTYMDEALQVGFTLQARNALNSVTQNYTTASGYAKLDPATPAQLGLGARDTVAPTQLTARVVAVSGAGTFTAGEAAITARLVIGRAAAATADDPTGPYTDTRIGILPLDADGTTLRSADLDADMAPPAGNDRKDLGVTTEVRFGRLRIQNSMGSERVQLPVPLVAEYWNGSAFVGNAADSCTAIPRSAIALDFSGSTLGACATSIVQDPNVTFASGVATLRLSAPGARGHVLVRPNLATAGGSACTPGASVAGSVDMPYLLGRWDDAANPDGNANTNYDDKPSARGTFGLYGSQPNNFIFFRENF